MPPPTQSGQKKLEKLVKDKLGELLPLSVTLDLYNLRVLLFCFVLGPKKKKSLSLETF